MKTNRNLAHSVDIHTVRCPIKQKKKYILYLVDEVLGVHGLLGGVGRLEDGEGHRRPVVLGLQHPRLQLEPSVHTDCLSGR